MNKLYIDLYNTTFRVISDTERGAAKHFDTIKRLTLESKAVPSERFYLVDSKSGLAVQGASNQVDLYCQAAVVRGRVTSLMKKFSAKKLHPGTKLKRNLRIAEKAFLRPGGDEGSVTRTLDLVRDMYEADSIEEAATVLTDFCTWPAVQVVTA